VPVPPRHREVLERGPAHGCTQPATHGAGVHGGVVRPVARPAGRVEGPDVVSLRHVPERDAGLDVADTEPRGGLPHPAEEEEVLPVRDLEPDVLEREGRLSLQDPLISMGWKTPWARSPPSLSRQTSPAWRACMCGVWCVVRVVRAVRGVWCVVRVACVASDRRKKAHANSTQRTYAKSTRKRHRRSFEMVVG